MTRTATVMWVAVSAALTLGACSSAGDSSGRDTTPTTAAAKHEKPADDAPLRELAAKRKLRFGTAVAADPLRDDPGYARTLAREYDAVTPENAMKWDTIHPEQDRYDFGPADEIVDFARRNDMAVRGHTLVWYRQVPSWVTDREWTRPELEQVLHDHIRKVVGHYRGKVAQWDVVNEAIDDQGKLRDTVWSRVIGPDYIDLAFTWAHEADPNAELYYNDYDIERPGPKGDAAEELVIGLEQRDVPIDGVGIQGHELTVRAASNAMWRAAIERFERHGLDVAVTELDVGIFLPATEKNLEEQADIYRDVLNACLSSKRCHTFVTWGFTDKYSWIPGELPGFGDALPFDESYEPKPVVDDIRDELTHDRPRPGPAPVDT